MSGSSLPGRVVLVTGANHGIGAATARAFAARGSRVFLTYHRDPVPFEEAELEKARADGVGGVLLYRANQRLRAEPIADEIRSRGGEAVAVEADLADAANVVRLFDLCETRLGPADDLVVNHTSCVPDTFDPARVTPEGFGVRPVDAANVDATLSVNARATALLIAEYARRHVARGATRGSVVTLSTDAAHAHAGSVSYAASKHAVESYSRSAAVELGRYGITVNVVAPGPIQTGYLSPAEEAEIARRTPLGRVGRPEDVAGVIVFLAGEEARWLTGQLLYVGGGFTIPQ